jgi:hypothetical protein
LHSAILYQAIGKFHSATRKLREFQDEVTTRNAKHLRRLNDPLAAVLPLFPRRIQRPIPVYPDLPTRKWSMEYAFLLAINPTIITEGDTIELHSLGVLWPWISRTTQG